MSISDSRQRMFQALLAISQRNSERFHMEDGEHEVRVRGPFNTAVYRADRWVSQFTRHVYSGYFDRQHVEREREAQLHAQPCEPHIH